VWEKVASISHTWAILHIHKSRLAFLTLYLPGLIVVLMEARNIWRISLGAIREETDGVKG